MKEIPVYLFLGFLESGKTKFIQDTLCDERFNNGEKTLLKLKLEVDTRISSVVNYFEIFLNRMVLCRKACEKLGLEFKLIINEQQLM